MEMFGEQYCSYMATHDRSSVYGPTCLTVEIWREEGIVHVESVEMHRDAKDVCFEAFGDIETYTDEDDAASCHRHDRWPRRLVRLLFEAVRNVRLLLRLTQVALVHTTWTTVILLARCGYRENSWSGSREKDRCCCGSVVIASWWLALRFHSLAKDT